MIKKPKAIKYRVIYISPLTWVLMSREKKAKKDDEKAKAKYALSLIS